MFNIIARDQDDHVKNIAFPMDRQGRWSLAPAFDVTYSYKASGDWTAAHQISINGKRDQFMLADFCACAKTALLKRGRDKAIIDEVRVAVEQWPEFAKQAGVAASWIKQIRQQHRLKLPAA